MPRNLRPSPPSRRGRSGGAGAADRGLTGDQPPASRTPRPMRRRPFKATSRCGRTVQCLVRAVAGSVLLLAAIGLAITFGVMGVINMAHGEMVMIGAYVNLRGAGNHPHQFSRLFDYSLLIAVPLAFIVRRCIGILIERSIIRFLYGAAGRRCWRPGAVAGACSRRCATMFGPTNREVGPIPLDERRVRAGTDHDHLQQALDSVLHAGGIRDPAGIAALYSLGLEMRAVTQTRRMAASMGIATSRVDALTFGLGSGIAGIAGVALSQIDNVSPNLGRAISSIPLWWWCSAASAICGARWSARSRSAIANKFLEPVAGAVLGKIAILGSQSSCSSRSARAPVSHSRGGRWKHDLGILRSDLAPQSRRKLPLPRAGRVGVGVSQRAFGAWCWQFPHPPRSDERHSRSLAFGVLS